MTSPVKMKLLISQLLFGCFLITNKRRGIGCGRGGGGFDPTSFLPMDVIAKLDCLHYEEKKGEQFDSFRKIIKRQIMEPSSFERKMFQRKLLD